jgi:hypothetical protein
MMQSSEKSDAPNLDTAPSSGTMSLELEMEPKNYAPHVPPLDPNNHHTNDSTVITNAIHCSSFEIETPDETMEASNIDHDDDDDDDDDGDDDDDDDNSIDDRVEMIMPLVERTDSNMTTVIANNNTEIRSRKRYAGEMSPNSDVESGKYEHNSSIASNQRREKIRRCCAHAEELRRNMLRNTITFMSFMAKIIFWISLVLMVAGVVWYSKELAHHGTDPHLIAFFSAGAFVILGFPISIYGILMHLTNYYQPNVQCYVVRILWMGECNEAKDFS